MSAFCQESSILVINTLPFCSVLGRKTPPAIEYIKLRKLKMFTRHIWAGRGKNLLSKISVFNNHLFKRLSLLLEFFQLHLSAWDVQQDCMIQFSYYHHPRTTLIISINMELKVINNSIFFVQTKGGTRPYEYRPYEYNNFSEIKMLQLGFTQY